MDKNTPTVINHHCRCSGDALYGIGVIGALFYFLQHASTFSLVVIGICKAIFWPAVVLFRLLTILEL